MKLYLNKSFAVFFFLLSLSMITSMAGLSGTIIGIGIITTIALITLEPDGFKNKLRALKFDGQSYLALFAGAVLLSILVNGYDFWTGLEILDEIRWILPFFALIYVFRKFLTRELLLKCIDILIVVTYLLAVYAVVQHLFGVDLLREARRFDHFGKQFRATGFFAIALTFSYVIGSFGLMLMFLSYFNERKRFYYVSGAIACFISVYSSGTRGAWLALAFTLLFTFSLINRKVFVKCLIGLLIAVSIMMMDSNFRKRANTLVNIRSSGSNITRINIWTAYKEMYKDNPIFGVGYEQNREFLPTYFERLGISKRELVSHAHNDYLQVLVGTGIVGFIMFLMMLIFFLKKSYRLTKKTGNDKLLKGLAFGALAVQIYIYAGGLTQVNFTDSVVNYTLLYYWAILYFIDKELTAVGQIQNGK